jgi:hypothetical protein
MNPVFLAFRNRTRRSKRAIAEAVHACILDGTKVHIHCESEDEARRVHAAVVPVAGGIFSGPRATATQVRDAFHKAIQEDLRKAAAEDVAAIKRGIVSHHDIEAAAGDKAAMAALYDRLKLALEDVPDGHSILCRTPDEREAVQRAAQSSRQHMIPPGGQGDTEAR